MTKNRTTQNIRAASKAIVASITTFGKQSVRKLGEMINRSKSSAHRHLQGKERRNQHPESWLWETDAGSAWLRLQMIATLYQFGLKSGVGAGTLSQYFKMIRIDTHVGVSESAVRTQLGKMEVLLPQFQDDCEKSVKKQTRKIVAGLDETFFGEFIVLVLIDLRSGYLLVEDITEDRCFDTWYAKTAPRLESLGIEVNHVISDRAKALIKMAVTGFECESGADVFHAQQDASRWLGARIGKRVSTAEKNLEAAKKAEGKVSKKVIGFKFFSLKVNKLKAEKTLEQAKQAQSEYHDNLQGVGDEVHPFSLTDNSINDAEKVVQGLEIRVQAFEKIAKDQGIAENTKVTKKLRNQFQPLAVSISFWWFLVRETLQDLVIDDVKLEQWLTTTLLPVVYWHHKMQQTKSHKVKEKYRQAWILASDKFKAHPLTATLPESEIQRWLMWADNMARQFQRSSSAVEGRNGCLSQMYHNGRGLTEKRLRALTVIHNYGIKREDGTTAAMRLFDTEFPDLFSWLLGSMGELPLPRKDRVRVISNPLKLLSVPS